MKYRKEKRGSAGWLNSYLIFTRTYIFAKLMLTVYPRIDIKQKKLLNNIYVCINHINEHYEPIIATRCIHPTMISNIVDNY